MKLEGIFPPIATPFDHEGNLYRAKVQHNVEKWNKTKLGGYVVCGSTGESVYLTTEEKIRLWSRTLQPFERKTVRIVTFPQSGSNYPVNIVVKSKLIKE